LIEIGSICVISTPYNDNTKYIWTFLTLNALGIGRIDIVENRLIGVKSRGCHPPSEPLLIHLTMGGRTRDLRHLLQRKER
jgi:argininosuccinate synthase